MGEPRAIDFAKLVGFGTLSDQPAGDIDFRDETVAAKLGAKVGCESVRTGPRAKPTPQERS